jgi:hypothetical protein
MPSTYELIKGETLASSAASYTFTAIPSTFKDLVLRVTGRFDISNNGGRLRFNGDSSALYSWNRVTAISIAEATNDLTYGSPYDTFVYFPGVNSSTTTADTFSNNEMYLPNYTASANKPVMLNNVMEQNTTSAGITMLAGLYRSTTAISSIALTSDGGGNWVAGSSFYLYGIKNS